MTSEPTKETILERVAEMARNEWEHARPLYQSEIDKKLKALDIDYKSIIGPDLRLKRFLQENANGAFKIIQDPMKKARIAIVPPNADYQFPDLPLAERDGQQRDERPSHSKRAVFEFLRAVSRLDAKEIDKLDIPASILIKLLIGP